MNLKKIFNQGKEILEGTSNEIKSHVNYLNATDDEIFTARAKICDNCPLKNGNNCDTQRYINPETREVSNAFKPNFIRGCGCRLSAKQKSKQSACPAGFWGGEFNK